MSWGAQGFWLCWGTIRGRSGDRASGFSAGRPGEQPGGPLGPGLGPGGKAAGQGNWCCVCGRDPVATRQLRDEAGPLPKLRVEALTPEPQGDLLWKEGPYW